MQPAYVVDGVPGKLYVRAFSEFWQWEAARVEAVLNKGAAGRDA